MKISVVQCDVVLGDRRANIATMQRLCDGLRSDLIVLPELCTTGYLLDAEQASRLATPAHGPHLEPFVQLAQQTNGTVVAGILERDAQRLFNTTVVVDANGLVGKQRKMHLTRLEAPLFTPGDNWSVFTVGEARIGVITCFDAWFPEAARHLCTRGAQLLCQPAAFGGPRTLDIMRVRAMENRVFSVTANRIGHEMRGDVDARFLGRSQVIDCDGEVLAQAEAGVEAVLTLELDPRDADDKSNVMCADLRKHWRRYPVTT